MISAKMVKDLREKTGAGMMDCKKTLTEANGDMEKAVELLREKGLASAAKKAGRIAAEGIVATYISEDSKVGVALEVNCETDFVAVNENFVEFSNNVAKQIANSNVADVEALLDSKYMGEEKTVKETLTELIAKIGENMNIRRFEKLTVESGTVNSYIHAGGKIGVLVALNCEKENNEVLAPLAKDLAMQVAAINPLFLDETSVDEEALNKEREIYRVQALNEGKPEKIVEKMVEGRVKKYLKEVCLVDQVWVKNGDYTITKLLAEKSKEVGSPITIAKFVRFEKGEGIERKEENFAEEVQKQMQKK